MDASHAAKARRIEVTDERIGGFILEELREDHAEPPRTKDLAYALNMPPRTIARVIASAGLLMSLISAVEGYRAASTWLAVSLLTLSVGETVVLPHDTEFGTNWPFLYAFGDERPTAERLGQLRAILDELA